MFLKSYPQPTPVVAVLMLVTMLAEGVDTQENPYTEVFGWMQSPPSRDLGAVSGVYSDADENIWITERCGADTCLDHDDVSPIHLYDPSGRWVRSFGDGMFVWPHGIHIDSSGNIWVTDGRGDGQRGHQVFKFSPDGEVLMTLGEAGVAGDDSGHFDGPTDVLVAPNGDIFVSDGHDADSNNRVLKFSADGQFLMTWGTSGSAAGEFSVPHAMAMDSQGRLFVADRDNNRIQIFDQEGEFLEEWAQFGRATGLYIDGNDTIYVSDNQSNTENNLGWQRGIRVGDARNGSIKAFIPEPPMDPGDSGTTGPHDLTVNALGVVFGADVQAEIVRKFVHR